MPRVTCYAGTRYPERPTAFEWEEAQKEVVEVVQQARTPGGLRFVVMAGDGRRYRLEWQQVDDSWRILSD